MSHSPNKCWLFSDEDPYQEAPVFVQPGRYGDLILLLPAFRLWSIMCGKAVRVFVSMEFGSVLEGVSYVEPYQLALHWMGDTYRFVEIAKKLHPWVICTQLHGQGLNCVPDAFPSFSMTMWNRTGLRPLYYTLPLIFDRRNKEREEVLAKRLGIGLTNKPVLLFNLEGETSPLPKKELLHSAMLDKLRERFHLINLGPVRAQRIYDLLGLYDRAAGMITIDTATLHLAPASNIRYIALTRDDGSGQSGSLPKGNCELKVGYNQMPSRLKEIIDTVNSWA